jgi:phage repressor protein C with HTH and peptisase S24 domain
MFKQRELAEAINKRISVIGQRACRNSDYPLEDLIKISNYAGVDLINNSKISDIGNVTINIEEQNNTNGTKEDNCPLEEIKEETKEKYVVIPYWEHEKHKEKVVNPCFTEFLLDVQKLINVYGRSADGLKIIAMTGDEMDGGSTPIKNNDILIIDTKVNNTSSSGIYFYITNKSVFVRRIAEIEGKGLYFSVDNPLYTDVLNDTKTYKELEEVGFKVIGKVIGNESLSSRM